MIARETADWLQNYLPVNVKGLTVLDVGAGEGETAKFYIEYGAKIVVCIEPNKNAFRNLKNNAEKHKEIKAINKSFSLSDLSINHDFLKVDIEGYEEQLLNTELERPALIELHGLQLRDKFRQKGYRIIDNSINGFGCSSYGLWNC
jgi:SAM-dependent methyltransferase